MDAVPASVVERWCDELAASGSLADAERRVSELHRRIERYADAGAGSCWLGVPAVGDAVREVLIEGRGRSHDLIAWCVMPNHVHAVVRPLGGVELAGLVRGWKAVSARKANLLLSRVGPFWMRGYFDRYIRSPEHLERAIAYVEGNPVKAGLVARPEDWLLSSASERKRGEPAWKAALGEGVTLWDTPSSSHVGRRPTLHARGVVDGDSRD